MVGLFDRLKKGFEDEEEGEMVEEEIPETSLEPESTPEVAPEPQPEPESTPEVALEPQPEPESTPEVAPEPQPEPQTQSFEPQSSSTSSIGIDVLMDKRVKLEEAIDYVGIMIKNLKDNRT